MEVGLESFGGSRNYHVECMSLNDSIMCAMDAASFKLTSVLQLLLTGVTAVDFWSRESR